MALPLDVVANILTIRHEQDTSEKGILARKLQVANNQNKTHHMERVVLESKNAELRHMIHLLKSNVRSLLKENESIVRKRARSSARKSNKSTQTDS